MQLFVSIAIFLMNSSLINTYSYTKHPTKIRVIHFDRAFIRSAKYKTTKNRFMIKINQKTEVQEYQSFRDICFVPHRYMFRSETWAVDDKDRIVFLFFEISVFNLFIQIVGEVKPSSSFDATQFCINHESPESTNFRQMLCIPNISALSLFDV